MVFLLVPPIQERAHPFLLNEGKSQLEIPLSWLKTPPAPTGDKGNMFASCMNSLKCVINLPVLTCFEQTDLAVRWRDTCLTDLFIRSLSFQIAAEKFYLLFVSLPHSHFPNQACGANH